MSSYLLAFAVTDFAYIDNSLTLTTGQTYHRVYAREDDVARTDFALRSSESLLEELERFTSFDYEIEKMYSIAVPDFGAG